MSLGTLCVTRAGIARTVRVGKGTPGGAGLSATGGLTRAVAAAGLKVAVPPPASASLKPNAVSVFHSPSVIVPSTNGLLAKTLAQTFAFGASGTDFTAASTNTTSCQSDGF